MSLNLLTNLHLADSNWSVSVPDILVCSENIFITLSCSSLTKCFTAPSISRLNIYPLAFLRGSFHSLQLWASPRLCGRRSPINYSLMTSVAARLGRKKKLIYLSRGNCLGAVSAHESSLCSLFLSDRPDEGHLTIVITSMDWPATTRSYLPLISTLNYLPCHPPPLPMLSSLQRRNIFQQRCCSWNE